MIDRKEVTTYAQLAGATLHETGMLLHEVEIQRDRLRKALIAVLDCYNDTGELSDLVWDDAHDALQEAEDE